MIITISGTPGAGKSTVAKALAQKLGFKHYSAGDFMRAMAQERGSTLQELQKQALKDRSLDDEIDKRTIELAKNEDNFVMDARLAWHFIPQSIKILLTIEPAVAAQRIFAQRRLDEKENVTLEKTKQNILKRLQSEKERYQRLFNLDYAAPQHYDLVIDTTKLTVEKIVENIVQFLKNSKRQK